jgi:hypothetical protein
VEVIGRELLEAAIAAKDCPDLPQAPYGDTGDTGEIFIAFGSSKLLPYTFGKGNCSIKAAESSHEAAIGAEAILAINSGSEASCFPFRRCCSSFSSFFSFWRFFSTR